MKKILITGGYGFIGSTLLTLFKKSDFSICIIDNLVTGTIKEIPLPIQFIKKDLADVSIIEDIISYSPDIVLHLAAFHHIPSCELNPLQTINTNIIGTQNLLDALEYCKNTYKIIFASSGAVYKNSNSILFEDSDILASNTYSATKIAGENIIKKFSIKNNVHCTILRLFNIVGYGDLNNHLVPEIIAQLKENPTIIHLGNLHSIRSFIDVRDVANLIQILINTSTFDLFTILNVSSFESYSVKQIIEIIEDITKFNIKINTKNEKIRTHDNPIQLASIDKLIKNINWKPNIRIKDTIANILVKEDLIKNNSNKEYFRNKEKIEIDITYRCNLFCNNCNRTVSLAPSSLGITVEQIEKFISESISENYLWKNIRILGGEPTLHPNFLEIINLLLEYKKNYLPNLIIEVVSNGTNNRTKDILTKISKLGVYIDTNSFKLPQKTQNDFEKFNIAPSDLSDFVNNDFSDGCWITESCGTGLTPFGYYPCAIAGGIDRVFGFDLGRKHLPSDTDEMKDLLKLFCSYCGHYKNRNFDDKKNIPNSDINSTYVMEISKTWKNTINLYNKKRPKLNKY